MMETKEHQLVFRPIVFIRMILAKKLNSRVVEKSFEILLKT
jgi:hypothetical protein